MGRASSHLRRSTKKTNSGLHPEADYSWAQVPICTITPEVERLLQVVGSQPLSGPCSPLCPDFTSVLLLSVPLLQEMLEHCAAHDCGASFGPACAVTEL